MEENILISSIMRNKRSWSIILGIMISIFSLTACDPPDIASKEVKTVSIQKGAYTGSLYKGNYVYGAAMNLAWNELRDLMKKDAAEAPLIALKTTDPDALATTNKLNHATFSKQDLDDKSYYIKSGYGQKTIDAINKEVREKFPQKSFNDLKINLDDKNFIAYAYLLKKVKYLTPFKVDKVLFNAEKVKGFIAENDDQKENITVINYWNDDKFILSVALKENNEQLFLAKGFDMSSPDEVLQALNEKIQPSAKGYISPQQQILEPSGAFAPLPPPPEPVYAVYSEYLGNNETFAMPSLALDYYREYEEMIDQPFANKGFEDYAITAMYENIRFTMDAEGAKVENEAVITGPTGAPTNHAPIRQFLLNKPFWVIMKQQSSTQPYFLLGINNTELMEKIEKK